MALFVRDREFYKKILVIGLPIAAQQIITAGVNMMDTIMLGRLPQGNEIALAASSMATQAHSIFQFMSMGMGMGASVLIARYWGAGDTVRLRKSLCIVFRCCILLSALYTALIALLSAQIMALLTPDTRVIQAGCEYLRWSLPCYFLHGMSLVATTVLRNSHQMKRPLYTAIGAFFVNIFFNWVFIFGKLGAPAMGVAGAALGTLISRCFEFSMNCGYLFFKDKVLQFRPRDILAPCGDMLGEFLRISIPVMISDTLLGLGNSAVSAVGGHIGQSFMTAASVTTVIRQATTIFASGLSQSAVIITGNTLGKEDAAKAQRQGVTFTSLAFILGAFCGVLILTVSPYIAKSYNLTPETHAVTMELLKASAFVLVFMVPSSVLTKGVLRGGGDTRLLMVLDVIFLWIVSVPMGYLSGIVWGWSPFWVYACLNLDKVIKTALCILRLKSGKWIKKIKTA